MIDALLELGKWAVAQDNRDLSDPIDILIDNPATSDRYKHVLLITLDALNDYAYAGVEVEEFSKEKLSRYLYKRGSPRGTDVTPTCRVAKSLATTLDIKIISWFKNALQEDLVRESAERASCFNKIHDELEAKKEQIVHDLAEHIDRKESYVLSILIIGGPRPQYVGDFAVFRELLEKRGMEMYYQRYGTESRASDALCSVCKKIAPEVYGFASPFKFYTVDKPGFVSGGFSQSSTWKNYPVCKRCALVLEAGRKYLERYFNFRMYGLNYFIVPKVARGPSDEAFEIFAEYKERPPKLDEPYKNLVEVSQEDIYSELATQSNFFNFNLLFYERSNAAFRILLYAEDILPSYIGKLFEVKSAVERHAHFQNVGKDTQQLFFNFGTIYTFFPSPELTTYFLEVVNSIFTHKGVDCSFLFKWIMKRIRSDYAANKNIQFPTLRGLQLLLFLSQLGVLKMNGSSNKLRQDTIVDQKHTAVEEAAERLFVEFGEFFDSDAKRAVFLEGALTQLLLNLQYRLRRAQPFKSKLNGLKIDERLCKRLLPEIQNKFREYDADYYRNLEKVLSKYLVKAGDHWGLTTDAISFYFVTGMNLSEYVKAGVEGAGTQSAEEGGIQ